MTFNFFNTSRLAFGSKLTAAFKQLNNMMDNSLEAVDRALSDLDYYQQYINKNYRVPAPIRPQMAVRTNEIFSVIDEMNPIKELSYDEGIFTVRMALYNNRTHRITNAYGITELTEGYAFVMPSSSNTRIDREIRFSSSNNKQGSEILLFKFRIDDEGRIFLGGDLREVLRLYPQDATQYTGLSKGSGLTLPYTAQGYECLCLLGYRNNIDVKVNGESIIRGAGGGVYDNYNHAIVYVKKGDVISGTISSGFKVNYNF